MLKKVSLFLFILPFILAFVFPQGSARAETTPADVVQATASELIAAVNSLRSANGLAPYSVSSILMQTAQGQADYMAATGQVTHSGAGGLSLTQRLLGAGYPLAGDLSQGGFRAENIAGGSGMTAAVAVQSWQGDALHLNTMLSPTLTEIGAGVAKAGNVVYFVIDCALPTTSGVPQAYTPAPGEPTIGPYSPGDFIAPVVTSTPDATGSVYHEVQYGQTLWAIAIAYGVKIDQIRALNNLGEGTEIYQGDRLLVRKDAPPPPTATSTPSVLLDVTQTVIPAPPSPLVEVYPPSPIAPPAITATSPPAAPLQSEPGSTVGIVVGVLLLALFLVGYLSWARKPV
ncbi:MAG: CAP domain-containing protein [Chloroflexota bacterium]